MSSSTGQVADSVRLAWPAEAVQIAELQRRGWTELPPTLADPMLVGVSLEDMTEAWHTAITRPPRATCRVLVAVDSRRLTGFATTVPSGDEDADPATDGEIDQFVIDPAARHAGHGSRLLHACIDTMRADGFVRASYWIAADDDVLRGFLSAAGWAADGAHREIGVDDGSLRVKQIRLHTAL